MRYEVLHYLLTSVVFNDRGCFKEPQSIRYVVYKMQTSVV